MQIFIFIFFLYAKIYKQDALKYTLKSLYLSARVSFMVVFIIK